ncbi:MAG: hypothetical protein HN837_02915, partial [Chloroflexi bacterium]|nr:hypothetical protein [Chloroflexota bacterium]
KVIDRLGFKIMQAGDKRADGHPLYYRVIDRIIDLRNYLYRMQEG